MKLPQERLKLIQELSALERLRQPDPEDWLKEFDSTGEEKANEGGLAPQRIHLNDDSELHDRTRTLGVTEEQLRKAVAAVGDHADAAREFLKK